MASAADETTLLTSWRGWDEEKARRVRGVVAYVSVSSCLRRAWRGEKREGAYFETMLEEWRSDAKSKL